MIFKNGHQENFLTCIFFILYSVGFAKAYKQNNDSNFTDYINSLVIMGFEKLMGYPIPELFELVSKAQMIQLMEQTFNNPAMKFEVKIPPILAIDVFQTIEGKYYSLLTYSKQMDI